MNFKKITFILCAIIFLSSERNVNAQSATFNYVSNATQTWAVPCGVSSATVQLWGAGGAAGNWNNTAGLIVSGGSGSYYSGVLTGLTGGTTVLTLYVPSGGVHTTSVAGGAGGWPGGGQGGNDVTFGEEGGGGGGYAGIKIGATYYVVAGAGGGGGSYDAGMICEGGGGGATTGTNGGAGYTGGTSAGGGTLIAGGAAANTESACDPGTAGIALTGGMGGGTTCSGWLGGGGGGAGWFGGGGGGDYGGGGGGGSSYPGAVFTSAGITFTPTSNLQGTTVTTAVAATAPGGPPVGIGTGGYMANGGNGYISITWTLPTAPSVVGNVVSNELCNGGNNASASETVTGGSSPYTYLWTPTAKTTATATGLTAGTYTIKVTDACGNSASASVSITQPTAVAVTTTVTNNVSCNAGSNGSASSTVSGGTGAYTYSWTGGGTNSTVSGLTAGIYTLTVTDHNGCTGTSSATITQPAALSVSSTATNVLCNGGNSGSASSTVSGGTTPYTYAWTGGGSNSTETGLTAGTYTLTVTDANGCSGTASAAITQPAALTVAIDSTTNLLCNGANTGSAASIVGGGTSPYTYLWTGGGTNSTVTGLTAGTYTLTVTDANGCTGTAAATITQPAAISLAHSSTPDNGSGNGTATVTASGGTSPYNYLWTPGGKTTAVITNEVHGTYCCTVTDASGCKDSVCVTINKGLGIDGITSNSSQITVYPNPNNGQFTIKSSVGGASTVEIYNVLGEKVFTRSLSTTEGTNTIDISNQSTGVYLYRVISVTGDLLGEGKIILQK